MKLNSKVRKISGLFMMMLVVGMILVTPSMACPLSQDGPCSQDADFTDDSGAKVEATELSGVDLNEATAKALSDEGVLKLREELIKSGYKPSIENISATKFTMENESGTITSTLVGMPFSGKYENETAVISFTYNELGSTAAAVVVSNGIFTVLGYDSVSGTVQILRSEYWDCVTDCVCNAEPAQCAIMLGACLGACGSCIATPNPWTCLACASCLFGFEYCVWDCQ